MVARQLAKKLLIVAIGIPMAFYGMFLVYLYITQEDLIFSGTTLPPDHHFDFDVPFREINVSVDGAKINSLYFRQPNSRGLVFFLHGNGGNLETWTSNVEFYQRINYDMFMLDYRGYGKSTGQIESESQLHEDIRAAWDVISPNYDNKPIVIYGRSLGAALAVKLAKDVRSDLVILVSPFSSMLAMAKGQYPLVPSSILRYPLRNDEVIPDIDTPIILVHGDKDTSIPISHSYELQELAKPTTKLLVIEGANHGDIHHHESYIRGLTNALPN
jgi:alpha-beta hydrolase superfamily lysophospholipase